VFYSRVKEVKSKFIRDIPNIQSSSKNKYRLNLSLRNKDVNSRKFKLRNCDIYTTLWYSIIPAFRKGIALQIAPRAVILRY